MNNFTLHTPTKILFGQGQIAQLREQLDLYPLRQRLRATQERARVAQDRLAYWTSAGAKLSPTVERLVRQYAKAQAAPVAAAA